MIGEKRMTAIGIAAVAALLLFLIFVYIPKYRSVNNLALEIKGINKQIAATEEMAGDIRNLGIIIADMQREVDNFESRLPTSEEISAVLSECSNIARECSIEVVSIISDDPKPFVGPEGEEFIFGEQPVSSMQVAFKLRGTYKHLADYVRNLRESLNILATLDEIEVERDEDILPRLDAELMVTVYVLDMR